MLRKIKSFLFENRTAKQTVAKNTFWLSVSNFGGRLIKAVVIIYAARILGTAGYGVFSYALTLAGFLTFFMDPGINSILVRDAAKTTEEGRREFFSTMFGIKIFLLIAGVCVVLFAGPFFSTLPGAKTLLPIVALVVIGDTLRDFFLAIIRSREKMEWEAGVFLLTNTAIMGFGFVFLFFSPTARSLGWGYAAGTFIGAAAAVTLLRPYFKKVFASFNISLIAPVISSAWPFAVTGALGGLLTSADILIVSWMRSASDVGIYAAAIRIIQILYLIPIIFQFSTLPILSRLANADDGRFRLVFERTVSLLFLISMPIAFGGAVVGTQLMTLLFGAAYAPGGLSFKLLALGLIFDYPAAVISSAIFAYNHQKSLIIVSAIAGTANVVFDLLLIPYFGIAGSAIATLITQVLSNWYLWSVMKKLNYFSILPHLKRIVAASLLMVGVSAWLYFAGVNVVLNVLLSGTFYAAILWVLREPLLTEIRGAVLGGPTVTTV